MAIVDLDEVEFRRKAAATLNPAVWANRMSGGEFILWPHVVEMGIALSKLAHRHIRRLMMNVPIRHGKSFLTCREYVVWYLSLYPDHRVLIVTHGQQLASEWGSECRALFEARFGPTTEDTRAKDEWRIKGYKGGLTCRGLGGSITGRGFQLIIIDDPHKNQEEALSLVQREKVWNYWRGTVRGRLEPGGVVVISMARYHEDDLCGRILGADKEGAWTLLDMPGISLGEGDVLGRPEGEALCPERFTEAELLEMKREADMGPAWFEALVQQRPRFLSEMDALLSAWEIDACRLDDRALIQVERLEGHIYGFGIDPAKTTDYFSFTILDKTSYPYIVVWQEKWQKGEFDDETAENRFYFASAQKCAEWIEYWDCDGGDYDTTGVGVGFGEMLRGALKGLGCAATVRGVTYSPSEKARIAKAVAAHVWQGKLLVPVRFGGLLDEMGYIQHVNAAGERYAAKVGYHDDEFYSLAHAIQSKTRPPRREELELPERDLADRMAASQRRTGAGAGKVVVIGG